jgi:uroporphyrinogen-III synthase
VIARGPKPVAALRELGVPIAAVVPEPNTWRELLHLLDEKKDLLPLKGRSVAVQEYGVPSPELLAGLAERGAQVLPVRIYEWSLPEDTAPLRQAIHAVTQSEIDILLVTAAVQIRHLLQVADEMSLKADLIGALSRVVVGSIGPVTSSELRQHGIAVDLEPSHPKMGFLVKEVAERCSELLLSKRVG